MKLKNKAVSGTKDKSDIYIELEPCTEGIHIALNSVVYQQFGKSIERTILSKLEEMGINDAIVYAEDFGAPEFVINARLETAAKRSIEEK